MATKKLSFCLYANHPDFLTNKIQNNFCSKVRLVRWLAQKQNRLYHEKHWRVLSFHAIALFFFFSVLIFSRLLFSWGWWAEGIEAFLIFLVETHFRLTSRQNCIFWPLLETQPRVSSLFSSCCHSPGNTNKRLDLW